MWVRSGSGRTVTGGRFSSITVTGVHGRDVDGAVSATVDADVRVFRVGKSEGGKGDGPRAEGGQESVGARDRADSEGAGGLGEDDRGCGKGDGGDGGAGTVVFAQVKSSVGANDNFQLDVGGMRAAICGFGGGVEGNNGP